MICVNRRISHVWSFGLKNILDTTLPEWFAPLVLNSLLSLPPPPSFKVTLQDPYVKVWIVSPVNALIYMICLISSLKVLSHGGDVPSSAIDTDVDLRYFPDALCKKDIVLQRVGAGWLWLHIAWWLNCFTNKLKFGFNFIIISCSHFNQLLWLCLAWTYVQHYHGAFNMSALQP